MSREGTDALPVLLTSSNDAKRLDRNLARQGGRIHWIGQHLKDARTNMGLNDDERENLADVRHLERLQEPSMEGIPLDSFDETLVSVPQNNQSNLEQLQEGSMDAAPLDSFDETLVSVPQNNQSILNPIPELMEGYDEGEDNNVLNTSASTILGGMPSQMETMNSTLVPPSSQDFHSRITSTPSKIPRPIHQDLQSIRNVNTDLTRLRREAMRGNARAKRQLHEMQSAEQQLLSRSMRGNVGNYQSGYGQMLDTSVGDGDRIQRMKFNKRKGKDQNQMNTGKVNVVAGGGSKQERERSNAILKRNLLKTVNELNRFNAEVDKRKETLEKTQEDANAIANELEDINSSLESLKSRTSGTSTRGKGKKRGGR